MKNINRSYAIAGIIVLAVLVIVSVMYFAGMNNDMNENMPGDQTTGENVASGTPRTPGQQPNGGQAAAQLRTYAGVFYTFKYTSDWEVKEINRQAGEVIVYPKSLAAQAAAGTISTTDRIKFSFIDANNVDVSELPTSTAGGNTWHIRSIKGTPEGGTENESLEYLLKMDNEYLVIFSGPKNRSAIESLISEFVLK